VRLGSITHRGEDLSVETARYGNGRTAVLLVTEGTGERYATLSTNLAEGSLADNEFYAKTYSENTEIAQVALASGLFTDTGRSARSGFVSLPIWRINDRSRS
jgi:hypothetical protein